MGAYSHIFLELSETFHGSDGGFEFGFVNITGSIGIDLLESSFDGLLVFLGDFDIVLLLNFLDEGDHLIPGDGTGTISIEDLENIFPAWWPLLFGGGGLVQRANLDGGSGG